MLWRMSRPSRMWWGMLMLFVAWTGLVWLGVRIVENKRISDLVEETRSRAQEESYFTASHIERSLAYLRHIPPILANDPTLIAALTRFGPDAQPSRLPQAKRRDLWLNDRDFGPLETRLQRLVKEVSVDQMWVVNAAGDCIASGGFDPSATATGRNYANRAYFHSAREGRPGRQFAIGQSTSLPGLYFSSPVFQNGAFLGAVIVKIGLGRLELGPDSVVTDENGVVILAADSRLLLHSMRPERIAAMPDAERIDRYGLGTIPAVGFKPWLPAIAAGLGDDLKMVDGQGLPVIVVSIEDLEDAVSVHILRPLTGLDAIRDVSGWLFSLLLSVGFLGLVLIGIGITHLHRRLEHGRDLARLNALLEHQANTDPLTGCANRRHFMARLETERYRGARYGNRFSLLAIDVDHFKSINDRFGHAGGDQALERLVMVISHLLRPTDLLGRIGGEEFAVLLAGTGLSGALATAERIREAVEAESIAFGRHQITFTVSGGVAEWNPARDEAGASLMARADQVLYLAKNKGRNRIEIDGPIEA